METLFRILVVVALALGVVALVGRPGAPEIARTERDPDDVRRIAALEQRVRELEARAFAPAPAPADAAEPAPVAEAPDGATALDAAIDRRLDERLPRFRENLVKELRLDEPKAGPPSAADAAARSRTLEEIGEEVGLNANEIDFIRTEREAMEREFTAIFKDEGETDEAFALRMANLARDPDGQAEVQQRMMTRIMAEGGLAKMMAIQAGHDRAIRERIGDDRFRKYKAREGEIQGSSGLAVGFDMRTRAPGEEGR